MYNCINEAFEYLKNKYGYNKEYNLELNPITEEKDKVIELLMNQYYYGMEAKKELYYKLIEYGVLDVTEY